LISNTDDKINSLNFKKNKEIIEKYKDKKDNFQALIQEFSQKI